MKLLSRNINLFFVFLGLVCSMLVAYYQYVLYLDFVNVDLVEIRTHIDESRSLIAHIDELLGQVQIFSDLSEFESPGFYDPYLLFIIVSSVATVVVFGLGYCYGTGPISSIVDTFFKKVDIPAPVFDVDLSLPDIDLSLLHHFEYYIRYLLKLQDGLKTSSPVIKFYLDWTIKFDETIKSLYPNGNYPQSVVETKAMTGQILYHYANFVDETDRLRRYHLGESDLVLTPEQINSIIEHHRLLVDSMGVLHEASKNIGAILTGL